MYIIDIHNKFIINYNMKLKYFIYIVLLSLVINQDRTTLFSTGSEEPDPSWGGYPIHYTENEIYGAADRFYLGNEYVLERAYVYLSYSPEDMFDLQAVEVQIRYDDGGRPGEILTSQIVNLDYNNADGLWYSISFLEEDCLKTEASNSYWIAVVPTEGANVTWVYSEEDDFLYSTTTDGGENWETLSLGRAGSAAVTGEQIYIPPFDGGDVNGDFVVNVLDVVAIVQYILGNADFDDDQIAAADLTQDGGINILDVVAMINIILYDGSELVTDFLYEDINVNSETFGQLVGPPIYQGMITGYYFGKAG